ncbi:Acetylxylan esterase 2 [Colletotrichum sidae]|uniref:Cutinase n=1 Tax=Colletotrichum sidae TaxID=1347389 RepID=A0A4R8TLC9_9PEZI|nr:Acetylxylan esterase 2 [Colletotrichum sidae]
MVSTLSAALALTLALPLASASSVAARQSTGAAECRDVHVFLARGNNEPYPGRQGKLAAAICAGLDGCDYEDIRFWNPLEAPYCRSVEEGAANGTAQVAAYNARCPDAKLVLSGYSQGGHVVGDMLGGGGGTFFQDCRQKGNAGLDASKAPGNKISAVLIFGDVRHTANQAYNYLSGAGAGGLFPRPADQLAGMAQYADVLRSYCVDSDPICAGGDTSANHLNYFDIYSTDAGKWVQELVGKAAGAATTTSMTTTSSKATSTSSGMSSRRPSATSSVSAAETTGTASAAPSSESTAAASATTSPTADNAASSPTPTADSAAGVAACNVAVLGLVAAFGLTMVW